MVNEVEQAAAAAATALALEAAATSMQSLRRGVVGRRIASTRRAAAAAAVAATAAALEVAATSMQSLRRGVVGRRIASTRRAAAAAERQRAAASVLQVATVLGGVVNEVEQAAAAAAERRMTAASVLQVATVLGSMVNKVEQAAAAAATALALEAAATSMQSLRRGVVGRRIASTRRAAAAAAAAATAAALEAAATSMQSLRRGVVGRRIARTRRAAAAAERQRAAASVLQVATVLGGVVNEVEQAAAAAATAAALETAATSVQSFWRGVVGRRIASTRRAAAAAERQRAAASVLQVATVLGSTINEVEQAAAAAAAAAEAAEATRRVAAARRAAETRKAVRDRWWRWFGTLLQVLLVVGVMALAVHWLSSVRCRGSSLRAGDPPLTPGECIESENGSRYFGFLPGSVWKSRLTVTEDGAMYSGPDGVEVYISYFMPPTVNSGCSGDGGGGSWCQAERFLRKITPFVEPLSENDAVLRGESLSVGYGLFCRTLSTQAMPKTVWNVFRGRRGVAQFSDATGELEVVNGRGDVLWSTDPHHVDGAALSSSSRSGGAGSGKWLGVEWVSRVSGRDVIPTRRGTYHDDDAILLVS
eukprot:g3767.t1